MAEKFAFDEVFRQGRTVQRDERPLAPLAGGMDGMRGQLLACAAFAHDQNIGIGLRDLSDGILEILHNTAVPDDIIHCVLRGIDFLKGSLVHVQLHLDTAQLVVQHVKLSGIAHQNAPIRADHHSVFSDWDSGGNHLFAMDILCLSRFRNARLDHNVHSRVLNDLGNMPPDGVLDLNPQKVAISLRHVLYVSVFVNHYNQFIRRGQHGLEQARPIDFGEPFSLFHNTLSLVSRSPARKSSLSVSTVVCSFMLSSIFYSILNG